MDVRRLEDRDGDRPGLPRRRGRREREGEWREGRRDGDVTESRHAAASYPIAPDTRQGLALSVRAGPGILRPHDRRRRARRPVAPPRRTPPAPAPETLARLAAVVPGRRLLARATSSPLELLVATILSAQCTDARVNLVTPGALPPLPGRRGRSPGAPRGALEKLIRSTGFFNAKAKARSAAPPGRSSRSTAARSRERWTSSTRLPGRRTEDRERRPRKRLRRAGRRRRRHARRPARAPARLVPPHRSGEGRARPERPLSPGAAGSCSATRSSFTAARSAPRGSPAARRASSPDLCPKEGVAS